jgi:glycosyltransferase involved in cell wall biosynthesis
MKGKDIIIIGIQSWDIEIGSNCKNIAIEMAKNNRVLYVNAPLDRISRWKERNSHKIKKRLKVKSGKEPDLIEIENNLWNLFPKSMIESINWMKNPGFFDYFNKHNAKLFARDIKSAIQRLGFNDFILFNDSSMFLGLYLKELIQPLMYVYYMRDYLTKNPYWKIHGVRIEPQLIKIADLVVNNSILYAEYGAQFNPHSYMVGQGCDTALFNNELRTIEVPDDLKSIKRPILGYVGYLSSRRLSIEIIEYLAQARRDWSIVLVGPEDDQFKVSTLHQMSNVYFLGSRDSSVLPNYIQGFDIAINPQQINDSTIGNYPRKIDEYLAMGKPTLASATKAMEYFKVYTYLGTTKDDYVRLAEIAMLEDNNERQAQRRAFGTSHSWENNVNEIYKFIESVAKEKNIKI